MSMSEAPMPYAGRTAVSSGCSLSKALLRASNLSPFTSGDTSVGMEYELQVVVEGKADDVDLPLTIRQSSFYRSTEKHAECGDLSISKVKCLKEFLDENEANIWENSWLRIEETQLGEYAGKLLAIDFLADKKQPSRGQRNDLDRFRCMHKGRPHLRIPASYLLKLALAEVLDDSPGLPKAVAATGRKLLDHFLSDNTSPEILSLTIPSCRPQRIGIAAARETARTFLFTQLLVSYANRRFGLMDSGQKCLIYNAPIAPLRQKEINDLVPDGVYRQLFVSPCLSGWDRGEEKHGYMALCHKTLSRSQLNAVSKLKDAGIITNNLVVLPNTSNTCLSNNGTHVSLGSKILSRMAGDPSSGMTPAVEKYFGDLVIKIVEHFLPLFVNTYTASPYRIDFADFHPEKVLGFLPHELDYTHLRMIWRRWKRKANIKFLGNPVTPFGPRSLDQLLARVIKLHGDLVPDFRLIDYLVTLLSTDSSPALDGRIGNHAQLVAELSEMGVFDSRMSIYLPYRMRAHSQMGYSGFEGRSFSLFPSLLSDMADAVDLQALVTALAYRYAVEELVQHRDIPDSPSIESERRQVFFGTAIGIPTFYVEADTGNRFLARILSHVKSQRSSKRYKNYIRVTIPDYKLALLEVIATDGADLIEQMGLGEMMASLKIRLIEPERTASARLLGGAVSRLGDRRSPDNIPADTLNAATEDYYRAELRKTHLTEGFSVLREDCRQLAQDGHPALAEMMQGSGFSESAAGYVERTKNSILDETADPETIKNLLNLCITVIHTEREKDT